MCQANEDIRAQYRYLDLRRKELADNLQTRSKVAHIIRNYLYDQGVSIMSVFAIPTSTDPARLHRG